MIQVLAPRLPRGWSWVWLPLAMAALMTSNVRAQDNAQPKANAEEPPAEAADAQEPPAFEVYPDELSKKAIQVFNPLTFAGPPLKLVGNPNDRSTVANMASGSVAPDARLLRRYVEYYASELSKRDNLNAFINPDPKISQNTARAIERAVFDLTEPIRIARANNNPGNFLGVYARQLFDSSFVKLLDNNLIARIDAMIVLGMVGSADNRDLDFYVAQINKPDQVMWVKQWAARGLTNAAQGGKKVLEASRTILAVEALSKFLSTDARTMPWPVQMRALEALGSLRTGVSVTPRGRTDAASVAMQYLADPEMKPEVRAWAAWALGMMKVSGGVTPYNFPLLADSIGRLAADLGDRIVAEYDRNADNFFQKSDEAALLTGILLFQVYAALGGEEGVNDSGLLRSDHPDASKAKSYLNNLDEKVKPVAQQAVAFLRSGGMDLKSQRDKLAANVAALKAFLAANPPKDRTLVPGGPAFPPSAPRVAGAPKP